MKPIVSLLTGLMTVCTTTLSAQALPQAATSVAKSTDSAPTEPATLIGHCDSARFVTYVLADGGLSTSGESENSTPASGSIAFRHLANGEEFRAAIGLKSINDTLHGKDSHDFAASLLAPASVGGTGSVDFMYRRFHCKQSSAHQQHGVKVKLGALRTIWAFDQTNAENVTTVQFASPVTIVNAAVFYSAVWINQVDKSGNLLAFGTDVGPIARWYMGERKDDEFTKATLGTTDKSFVGLSIDAWARFHNLMISGDFPFLSGKPRPIWARAAGPIVTFTLEAPIYTIINPPLP